MALTLANVGLTFCFLSLWLIFALILASGVEHRDLQMCIFSSLGLVGLTATVTVYGSWLLGHNTGVCG